MKERMRCSGGKGDQNWQFERFGCKVESGEWVDEGSVDVCYTEVFMLKTAFAVIGILREVIIG